MKKKETDGKVYLVGAGPGDIGLLTVKGMKSLQRADVVVYDFHLNAQILNYIKGDAEFIYAGKRGGHHEMTQDQINRVLVEKAKAGKTICRLKGGDPFIFGRGGEEAEVLSEEGIEFEVVPGISSAVAVPAYAGIPLTHRDYASSFVVVPGNEASTKKESNIDWEALARHRGTIVFLMAVKNIDVVSSRLISNGKSAETPVAVTRWGTRAEQKTIVSTLGEIPGIMKSGEIRPPAVVVVGDVVRLRERLSWFEKKPLFGQRILVTRESLSGYERLEDLGAELIQFPTIRVEPPLTWESLDRSIEGVAHYDWVVFTSANGVGFFFERLLNSGKDGRDLKGVGVCAIGPKTAGAVRSFGIIPDLVPDEFRAEGLIAAFGGPDGLKDLKILLPGAEQARDVFPEKVRESGGHIDTPVAYRALRPEGHSRRIQRFLKEGRITVATFTSGATFNNFCDIVGDGCNGMLRNVRIAAIGPVTARAIEKRGFKVDIMPENATVEALVEEIITHMQSSSINPATK
ncbi:MAG TPA: uroporphyrinogen-III C-methyltransferase [Nitrospirae bacterium]|nr:uroporphyrinogen-III C-methyltransferase [bacterium BMS3Abin08]HDO36896.1 uroporphyrinogen-III C-methyltransferase [Nitrospirota bacterium]HDY70924.1 uroporphyrinogen-III C-methyltransferase [Nitrospirota bacterium]